MGVDLDTRLSALQQQERTVEDLFTSVTPSVVQVTRISTRTNPYTMNEVNVPSGTGSGFVWDGTGNVVTNFHVVQGADAAKVNVVDGSGKTITYDASLVGYNPDKDVAVLKIAAGGAKLQPIQLGASAGLRVGQTALAIGNPFGLDHTLTVGVVSGLGREMTSPSGRPISDVIQTDAAINPGNSGGALLDSRGRLIGMSTAIYSPSGASAGIGFAVPVDTLKQQVEAILAGEVMQRPALGITYAQGAQARALERLLEGRVPRGVVVMGVVPGGGADRAGVRGTMRLPDGSVGIGDVIVQLDEAPVETDLDLLRSLEKKKPGDTIRVTVVRADRGLDGELVTKRVELPVKLQAADAV